MDNIKRLPRYVSDLVAACPTAGSGVNNWLFRCARCLHRHRDAVEIENLLADASVNCGRTVPAREIKLAVANSRADTYRPTGRRVKPLTTRKKLCSELGLIEEIVRQGPKLVDLWEQSPVRWVDAESHAEGAVDVLFPGNPLLCAGKSTREFETRTREEWRGLLEAMAVIVPSPMSARTGKTKNGKISAHSLANTGPRRFLVIECDFSGCARDGKTPTVFKPLIDSLAAAGISTLDMGAAVLAYLASGTPLAAAVHSGNKSVHGWFFCAGCSEERLRHFMQNAVLIGADPATWSPSQFVRMPDGMRNDGRRQTVYYFNPGVVR